MLPPAVCTSTGTEMAYLLSSTRKTTGSFRLQAVFMASQNSPSEVVPSPVQTTTTSSSSKASMARPDLVELPGAPAGLGAPHRLQELGARGRRGAHDAEVPGAGVARHLASAGGGVRRGPHGLEEVIQGRLPQGQGEGPIPVVEVEPVGGGTEVFRHGHLHRLVPRPGDLEEDLVLALEADLPIIHPPGGEHGPVPSEEGLAVESQEIAGGGGGGGGRGLGGHPWS
jgi:hypothetical protein